VAPEGSGRDHAGQTMTHEPPRPGILHATTFAPALRRNLTVLGAQVECVLLPERAARPGQPTVQRPAFRERVTERILREETQWQDDVVAITANRFPFAQNQQIFWARQPTREHDRGFLSHVFAAADRCQGSALINSIGAAASIAHAHAHVTDERLPFLSGLRTRPMTLSWLSQIAGVEIRAAETPFCLLAVRGGAAARAAAVYALQLCRMTAAVNVVSQDEVSWIFPRSGVETPKPHFPFALGSAEVWGRWCFVEEAAFTAATSDALEQALCASGTAPL
jgi:hypothetical protein